MHGLVLEVLLDVVVAGLLSATIYYCQLLNKRIRILQDGKSELARLIGEFDASTKQATASLIEIQNASRKITQNIDIKLDKANFLADDLAFMIEKGTKIARQLEGNIANPKIEKPRAAAPAPAPITPVNRPQEVKKPALESMISKLAGAGNRDAEKTAPAARLRSQSEQELLEALKSTRV